jgi:hypothetical protein
VLRPDRLHFIIRRKFAAGGRSSRSIYRDSFVGRERHDRLLISHELKNDTSDVILSVG